VYRVKAVDKWKVGYCYRANDVIVDTAYSLFLLLIYTQVVFIFSVELIIDSELVLF
jgi:hypothetical protein